jgi:hypothetical protein
MARRSTNEDRMINLPNAFGAAIDQDFVGKQENAAGRRARACRRTQRGSPSSLDQALRIAAGSKNRKIFLTKAKPAS